MKFEDFTTKLKNGSELVLRCAEPSDAQMLIDYLRITCGETPFLSSGSDEVADRFTLDGEISYIEGVLNSSRSSMILAIVDGKHAGNCSFDPVGGVQRVKHRCSLGISLYREFWGLGIGEILLRHAMAQAKDSGYEIMELEVMSGNERAISLYTKLGFEVYGKRPDAICYEDGSYTDELLMSIKL